MKSKRSNLIVYAIALILLLFLISFFMPTLQFITKVLVLLIYAFVNYVQIKDMKRSGEDIQKPLYFTIAVLILVGCLLFFT